MTTAQTTTGVARTGAAAGEYRLPEGFEHCSKLNPVREASCALERVRAVVAVLHGPDGCPWDGEQTNETLLKPLLEETYEYIDAVETADRDNMREELGDMLLQSVFQAQICSEDPSDPFDIDEVCDRLVDKLITRHPRVFRADDEAQGELGADDTLALWERMKQREKRRASVLDGISNAQGALPRSAKVVSRIRKSANADDLETAFDAPSALVDDYADRILEIVREAQRAGVDIERDLRNRLREVEAAIVDIEGGIGAQSAEAGLPDAGVAGMASMDEREDDADQ